MRTTILFLLLPILINAQGIDISIEMGDSFSPEKVSDMHFVGKVGDDVYTLKTISKKLGKVDYQLSRLDSDLKVQSSVVIDKSYKKNKLNLISIELVNNRIWAIESFYNQKMDKTFLFAKELDRTTLEEISDRKVIGEIDQKTVLGLLSAGGFGDSEVVFARNESSTQLALFINTKTKDSQTTTPSAIVFDENLEQIWSIDLKGLAPIFLSQLIFTDDGTLFSCGLKVPLKKNQIQNSYMVQRITAKGADEKKIEVPGGNVTQITMLHNEEFGLFVAGLYALAKTDLTIGGFMIAFDEVELEQSIFDKQVFETDNEIDKSFQGKGKRVGPFKNERLDSKDYAINFITFDDQSNILFGVERKITTLYATSSYSHVREMPNSTLHIREYFGDVHLLRFKESGRLKDYDRYEKTPVKTAGAFSMVRSFLIQDAGDIYLLYNDEFDIRILGIDSNGDSHNSNLDLSALKETGLGLRQAFQYSPEEYLTYAGTFEKIYHVKLKVD